MRRPARVAETVAALELRLSQSELAAMEEAAPPAAVAGSRYDERQMNMLDSEG
jgi:diketogulonate reductase-like aldo/keto reductase